MFFVFIFVGISLIYVVVFILDLVFIVCLVYFWIDSIMLRLFLRVLRNDESGLLFLLIILCNFLLIKILVVRCLDIEGKFLLRFWFGLGFVILFERLRGGMCVWD